MASQPPISAARLIPTQTTSTARSWKRWTITESTSWALAGYMKRLGPLVLSQYKGRMLNTHPALLPKFGGQGMFGDRVHKAVLAAGEEVSGATVHLVEGDYDTGPVLSSVEVPVEKGDTPETLRERVQKAEREHYVTVLERIARGEIELEGLRPLAASQLRHAGYEATQTVAVAVQERLVR